MQSTVTATASQVTHRHKLLSQCWRCVKYVLVLLFNLNLVKDAVKTLCIRTRVKGKSDVSSQASVCWMDVTWQWPLNNSFHFHHVILLSRGQDTPSTALYSIRGITQTTNITINLIPHPAECDSRKKDHQWSVLESVAFLLYDKNKTQFQQEAQPNIYSFIFN